MLEKTSSLWPSSSSSSSQPEKPFDPTDPKMNPLNPQGLKPCCACPQTKSARDNCFLKHDSSEATDKCKELVQSHLSCMRSLGFQI